MLLIITIDHTNKDLVLPVNKPVKDIYRYNSLIWEVNMFLTASVCRRDSRESHRSANEGRSEGSRIQHLLITSYLDAEKIIKHNYQH
jgi:hypothetical protein